MLPSVQLWHWGDAAFRSALALGWVAATVQLRLWGGVQRLNPMPTERSWCGPPNSCVPHRRPAKLCTHNILLLFAPLLSMPGTDPRTVFRHLPSSSVSLLVGASEKELAIAIRGTPMLLLVVAGNPVGPASLQRSRRSLDPLPLSKVVPSCPNGNAS